MHFKPIEMMEETSRPVAFSGRRSDERSSADDRRLQTRGFAVWNDLKGKNRLPAIEDLDLGSLEDLKSFAILFDLTTSTSSQPAVAFVGSDLAEASDLSEVATHILDLQPRSLIARLVDRIDHCIASTQPVGFEALAELADGKTHRCRGITLPFSTDGKTVDFVLGLANWHGCVASDLKDETCVAQNENSPAECERPVVFPDRSIRKLKQSVHQIDFGNVQDEPASTPDSLAADTNATPDQPAQSSEPAAKVEAPAEQSSEPAQSHLEQLGLAALGVASLDDPALGLRSGADGQATLSELLQIVWKLSAQETQKNLSKTIVEALQQALQPTGSQADEVLELMPFRKSA